MSNQRTYEIAFRIGARMTSSMRSTFANANRTLSTTSSRVDSIGASSGRVSGVMRGLGTAVGVAAGAAVAAVGSLAALSGAIGKVGVDYNAMMEQSQVAWKTLLGSQAKAQQMLKDISAFAKATPFETETVDMIAKYMHNAGLEGKALFGQLMKLSDVSSAFAIPADQAKEMARQMSQVQQAGVAYTEDLNILQDRGVPIYKALAKVTHTNVAAVKKLASQGQVTSKIYMEAFNNIAKGVKGASDAQSKTFNGMISTLKDNLKMIAGNLSKGTFAALKGSLETAMPLIEKFNEVLTKKGLMGAMDAVFPPSVANTIRSISSGFSNMNAVVGAFSKTFMGVWKGSGDGGDALAKIGIGAEGASRVEGFFKGIITAFTKTSGVVQSFFKGYQRFTGGYIQSIKKLFSGKGNVGQSFVRIFNVVKSVALPILQDAMKFIHEEFAKLKQFWDENGAQFIQAIKNAWSVIATILEFFAPVVLFIVKSLFENIKGVIDGALKIIMGLIKVFTGIFTGDFGKLWEGIKQIFVGAIKLLWNLWNLLMVGKLIGSIKAIGRTFFSFLKGIGRSIGTNVQYYYHLLVDGFYKIAAGIFRALFKGISSILRVYVNAGKTFIRIFSAARTFGVNAFLSLVSAINGAFLTTINFYKGIFSSAFTATVTAAKNFGSIIWSILKSLWSGIASIFGKIQIAMVMPFQYLKTVAGTVGSAVKGVFRGVFSGISGFAKGAINGLIMGANALIGALNGLHVNIPKWVPKVGGQSIGFSLHKIPMLATGGVTNGPTLAMIGEGSEQEAVLPLSKLQSLLDQPANPKGQTSEPVVIHMQQYFEYRGSGSSGNEKAEVAKAAENGARKGIQSVKDYFHEKNRLSFSGGEA